MRRSPILEIVSINSVDSLGAETLIAADTYQLREADSKWPRVALLSGSWSANMRIIYRAGYADRASSPQTGAEAVPVRYIQALKMWVEAMYDRDDKMMTVLLDAAERIVAPESAEMRLV